MIYSQDLVIEETINPLTHHYSSEEADAATAVGVRHHVSVTDGQEGDRDHPQGLHVVATQVPVVVVSVGIKRILLYFHVAYILSFSGLKC